MIRNASLMRKMVALAFAAASLAACGAKDCTVDDPGCNELANKQEWSVLQVWEAKLRDQPHDRPYIRIEPADDNGLVVLAFPARGRDSGYVVMLANSQVPPRGKTLPHEPFTVALAKAEALQADALLSSKIRQLILSMAR